MKRMILVALVSVVIGNLAGHLNNRLAVLAQTQSPRSRDAAASIPSILPVANPPLYPDPPLRPMHWTRDQLHAIYEARLAVARATGGGEASDQSPNGPNFQEQSFRMYTVGQTFRTKYAKPRLSNRAAVMSRVDDVDEHEGVSDFYVYIGGSGQVVTDGVIENRVYSSSPRQAAFSGAKVTAILPGEFSGQPIKGGHTFNVQPGDWLAIPPDDPHWPGFNPGDDGVMYLMLKVNIGYYPSHLHF